MTPDERDELLRDAERLTYQTIRSSDLYKELSSSEWDQLAERLGRVTLTYIEALIDEEFTRLEDAKELRQLRQEMQSHSLGDKPTSIAADKLRRLIELEAKESVDVI